MIDAMLLAVNPPTWLLAVATAAYLSAGFATWVFMAAIIHPGRPDPLRSCFVLVAWPGFVLGAVLLVGLAMLGDCITAFVNWVAPR